MTSRLPVLLALALVCVGVEAQSTVTLPLHRGPEQRLADWTTLSFPEGEYQARREAVMRRLSTTGGGVLLVPSAEGTSGGETFRQTNDFLYFTGLEAPASVLAIDADAHRTLLFAPRRDPRFESAGRPNDFPGRPLADAPALAQQLGIDSVAPVDGFAAWLGAQVVQGRLLRVNREHAATAEVRTQPLFARWSPGESLERAVRTMQPDARIENAFADVARLRMVKSPREQGVLRRAVATAAAAMRESLTAARDGADELAVQGVFESACRRRGAHRFGFTPIIKSGPNALWPWRVLGSQSDRRHRVMRAGEIVIFDVGCEVDFYTSDIGRTFPVSARFTPSQRALVELVRMVSDSILAQIRPGVTLGELQRVAMRVIPIEARPYMQTGSFFGHHIGLDSGDPSLFDEPLAAGMVFTVEPWYYNHDSGLAAFIEDNVLVTAVGIEVLSRELPRTAAGLESLRGAARRRLR